MGASPRELKFKIFDSLSRESHNVLLEKCLPEFYKYVRHCQEHCKTCNQTLNGDTAHRCKACSAGVHAAGLKCGVIYDDDLCWCSTDCKHGEVQVDSSEQQSIRGFNLESATGLGNTASVSPGDGSGDTTASLSPGDGAGDIADSMSSGKNISLN